MALNQFVEMALNSHCNVYGETWPWALKKVGSLAIFVVIESIVL